MLNKRCLELIPEADQCLDIIRNHALPSTRDTIVAELVDRHLLTATLLKEHEKDEVAAVCMILGAYELHWLMDGGKLSEAELREIDLGRLAVEVMNLSESLTVDYNQLAAELREYDEFPYECDFRFADHGDEALQYLNVIMGFAEVDLFATAMRDDAQAFIDNHQYNIRNVGQMRARKYAAHVFLTLPWPTTKACREAYFGTQQLLVGEYEARLMIPANGIRLNLKASDFKVSIPLYEELPVQREILEVHGPRWMAELASFAFTDRLPEHSIRSPSNELATALAQYGKVVRFLIANDVDWLPALVFRDELYAPSPSQAQEFCLYVDEAERYHELVRVCRKDRQEHTKIFIKAVLDSLDPLVVMKYCRNDRDFAALHALSGNSAYVAGIRSSAAKKHLISSDMGL